MEKLKYSTYGTKDFWAELPLKFEEKRLIMEE